MKAEIEFIFGKHSAFEVLTERPDVVVEAYVSADFSNDKILTLLDKNKVLVKILNLKNPPRRIS